MDWMIWVVCACSVALTESQRINLNPFAAFADQKYEPVADFSIQRGVYLQNMPTAQIFPIAGESINGVVGIPSLQANFGNPILPQKQTVTLANQNVHPRTKNIRNHRGPNQNQNGGFREQNINLQNSRGVTLDVRGGGYKVDQQQRGPRPYNLLSPGGNAARGTSQRPNNGRNTVGNENRNIPVRQRGPNLQNPHYNSKFETSMSSVPSNIEFVNPENVLPMHPRFYKQFLQNPQFASYLRSQNPQQSTRNNAGAINTYDATKQLASQLRNRGISPNAQFVQSSAFSNLPAGFQLPTSLQSNAQLSQQLGLSSQLPNNNPTFAEIFNSDPQFYSDFSKTPEGKAMLSEMYQHFGPSANKLLQAGSGRVPTQNFATNVDGFNTNFADFNKYSSAAATGFANGNPFAGAPTSNPFANAFNENTATDGQFNKPTAEDFAISQLYNLNQQQNVPAVRNQPVFRPQVQHQQQALQPQTQSQTYSSSHSFSNYGGRHPHVENMPTPSAPPTPSPEPPKQRPQIVRHQYNQYSAQTYPEDTSPGGPKYDPSTYQSSYQENPKVIDSSAASDTASYLSNFSPIDPISSMENTQVPARSYLSYPSDTSGFKAIASHSPSTALHEISSSEAVKERPSASSSFTPQATKQASAPGYWTPEQLFAPQSTGLQNESPFAYPSSPSTTSQHAPDEKQDGGDRAALHLSEDRSSWSQSKPVEYSHEYSEASNPVENIAVAEVPSTEQSDASTNSEEVSEEQFKASMRDLQKLWTRVPPRSSKPPTRATTVIYRSTSAPEVKTTIKDELKNHKTTQSYTFQYSPLDKSSSKSTAAWWTRKPDGSRNKVPAPETNSTSTSVGPTRTTVTIPSTTTTTTTTTTTESPPPTINVVTTTLSSTSAQTTPPPSHFIDSETPICALHNNLTYCLQDPEYPKDAIKEAIERNRHPLDHFLVDISAASNVVDDQTLHNAFENSAPLQSTSVSYSFEGKVISPNAGEMLNSTGCSSNVYYAKPLRALNTAGLWKVIVNVAFEDTGANYTQTVRIEECTHPPGYVATCGTHSISACLQQYKLYRLLAWESHRGFYIDAFLLPVACFCGSQDT